MILWLVKKDFPNAVLDGGVSVLVKPCYLTFFSGIRHKLDLDGFLYNQQEYLHPNPPVSQKDPYVQITYGKL